MHKRNVFLVAAIIAAGAIGCSTTFTTERNPFLTLTENFGASSGSDDGNGGGGTSRPVVGGFRRAMTVFLVNNHPTAELNFAFAAWVNVSSIRTADQQDTLLANGYVQLLEETRIGSVFALPPGTFVLHGPGPAGAQTIRLGPTTVNSPFPSQREIDLITPDVILVYEAPPVSCDSVAFYYTIDGQILFTSSNDGDLGLFDGATGSGGLKTLAQIDAYQCDPLKPGLFLKLGGGGRKSNEFFEGEDAAFVFNTDPDADGNFGIVTIAESIEIVTQTP